jgi:hypothetical protein
MDRIRIRNISQVTLQGHKPGAVFKVDAENGTPVDLYWRKRLDEGAIEIFTGPAVPNAVPSVSVSPPPPSAAPVPRPARQKKDA